jgi:S-adenosylmethionine:tRNA ribosyltransferase-isomerase
VIDFDPTGARRLCGEVVERLDEGICHIRLECAGHLPDLLDEIGHIPLPPYIRRPARRDLDGTRYQTVYAREEGAVAAPTAGLHFTEEVLAGIRAQGTQIRTLTLHVGLGTFRPVTADTIDEHRMHSEEFTLPEGTAEAIARTRDTCGRVVAVGTTCVRTLESRADGHGGVIPGSDATSLFIRPGYEFTVVNALLTNFHLPKSTLLMLVSAFAGYDLTREAYRIAIAERYRFFSYGDAMLVV